jgi:hemoglobin
MAPTMFQRYGGFARINKLVLAFYDRMLDSERVGPYFEGVDLARLIDHQTKFIGQIMGGPVTYSDEHLAQLHAHLHVDDAAFDEVVGLLDATLDDFGFARRDAEAILNEIERRRPWIVTRRSSETPRGAREVGAS